MALATTASAKLTLTGLSPTEIYMSNSAIEFDRSANANSRQFYMIGKHFAGIIGETPSEVYGLSKRFPAALMRWNAEHEDTPITMGDIDTWKNGNEVPLKFIKLVTGKKPTAKKSKAAPKPKATPKPKAKAQTPAKTKAAPKPSEMSAGDFKDHFEKITGRVFRLEKASEDHSKRLATLDAKLDVIMAYITEEPDSE